MWQAFAQSSLPPYLLFQSSKHHWLLSLKCSSTKKDKFPMDRAPSGPPSSKPPLLCNLVSDPSANIYHHFTLRTVTGQWSLDSGQWTEDATFVIFLQQQRVRLTAPAAKCNQELQESAIRLHQNLQSGISVRSCKSASKCPIARIFNFDVASFFLLKVSDSHFDSSFSSQRYGVFFSSKIQKSQSIRCARLGVSRTIYERFVL